MMTKLLLTTHWRADDARMVLEFLDELREIIHIAYDDDLKALYESQRPPVSSQDDNFDLPDDEIPF